MLTAPQPMHLSHPDCLHPNVTDHPIQTLYSGDTTRLYRTRLPAGRLRNRDRFLAGARDRDLIINMIRKHVSFLHISVHKISLLAIFFLSLMFA